MAVTCTDICELKVCQKMKLLGGRKAMTKAVTWPYVKTTDTLAEWLHGGEIVFAFGRKEENTEDYLLKLLEEAKKADITALVLLTDPEHACQITKRLTRRADEYEIALFKLPFQQKLVDITKEISGLIMKDKISFIHDGEGEEVTVLQLLLENQSREELLSHCYRRLQVLKEVDCLTGSELTKTLYYYLQSGNDLLHAAVKMYIHRNTMIGRMKKIGRLLNVNVNDPMVRTEYMNVFLVLKYMGMEEFQ